MAHDDLELHALVVQKLTKIFGEARMQILLAEILEELAIARVATLPDLRAVSEALQRRGGFEATTGAMLAVQAAMRGG